MSQFTPQQLQKAAALLELLEPDELQRGGKSVGYKHDLTGGDSIPYGHGLNGLFNTPGTEINIFSAMLLPNMGLLDYLPVMPSGSAAPDDFGGYDSPLYTTVTGVTQGNSETFSNQPDNICDTPPDGGLMKLCTLTAPYGRYSQCMRTIELSRVGRLTNRADPTDLRLMNFPDNQRGGGAVVPAMASGNSMVNIEVQRRLYEGLASFKRLIAPFVYTGNPSNNRPNDGGMQQIGLETLVNTGNKVDALTGNICTALDSDVKPFGFDLVNGTGRSIVNYLDTMFGYLEFNASRMGMNPVEWIVVMRPELFDEVVKVIPVEQHLYALNQISQFANGRVMIDATEATNLRMDMLNNKWLPIRGRRRTVILDDAIPEDNVTTNAALAAGQYASDIYILPMTVLGGIPVLWFESFRFENGNIRAVMELVRDKEAVWTSDGGRFLWWTQRTNTCVKVCWRVEPRIILRTPYLAGRITDVAYQPLQHFRQAFPADPYFLDGGRTNTTTGSYYTEYSADAPVIVP